MKTHLAKLWTLLLLGLCLTAARPAFAQSAPRPISTNQTFNELPRQLENVGIEDKAGSELPREATLVGSDGRSFILGEYMDADKPLILVLAYYKCPMLCSMVLNGLNKSMKEMGKSAGKDFRVLVVSFDPRDTTEVAHEKRENYASAYGRPVDISGFEYATGNPQEVKRIADAIGFHYEWQDDIKQYAHAAGLFVITPKGKLSQTFTGIEFPAGDVDAAVGEASKEVWHSPLKSVLLYCFMYDSRKGSYVPAVMNIMKVGGALTMLGIGVFLLRLFRGERRKKKQLLPIDVES